MTRTVLIKSNEIKASEIAQQLAISVSTLNIIIRRKKMSPWMFDLPPFPKEIRFQDNTRFYERSEVRTWVNATVKQFEDRRRYGHTRHRKHVIKIEVSSFSHRRAVEILASDKVTLESVLRAVTYAIEKDGVISKELREVLRRGIR